MSEQQELTYGQRKYRENREYNKARSKAYRLLHLAQDKAYRQQYYQKLKLEVLSHYSSGTPKCAFCGDDQLVHLTLDHLKDDGVEHRKKNGIITGTQTYVWARRNKYPLIFQVLCRDCNLLKGFPKHKVINFAKLIAEKSAEKKEGDKP